MLPQRCYEGTRLLGSGPCLRNVERIDSLVTPLVIRMMETGLQVDLDHFAAMEKTLVGDMDSLTEQVHDLTGYYINLNSSDQKSDLLFKKLKLKQARVKMTAGGDRESTDNEVLVAIQHDHPVVPLMLNHAELSKLLGTYVKPMPKLSVRVKQGEWRMFPKLGQSRIPSGRFNCKEPNLLAMPTRTERGREIRKGFITQPGWTYLSVDLSQIEVRIAAHCSQDPALCSVYFNEEDVYSDFATTAFKLADKRYKDKDGTWKYPTVDIRDHRRPAKTCVLAAIYDVTAGGLLAQMPIICVNCGKESTKHSCRKFRALWTENKCQDLLNSFYMRYPGILKDRKNNHAIVRKNAYIYDIWGRVLHTTAVRSVLEWVVNAALREAANLPYQGGACGVFKLGMAEVYDNLNDLKMWDVVSLALPIHDELLLTCRNDVADEVGELTKYRFENSVPLSVPLKASAATAPDWGSLPK